MTTATLTGSQRVLAALAVCLHPTAYSLAGDPEQLGDAHLRLTLLDKPNRPTTKLLLGSLRQPASVTIHNPHTTTNDPYLLARSSMPRTGCASAFAGLPKLPRNSVSA